MLSINPIKISVVVPCCNVEPFLTKCLDSIIKQTLRNIEIICVNDGSKDGTLKILREYEQKDSRIKVIDKENGGYGSAMNLGFSKVTGEYIAIVESDDWVHPRMMEDLYRLTNNGSIDIVKGNFWNCYERADGSFRSTVNGERHNMPSSSQIFTIKENANILYGHPSIWSAIYRRDFIKKNNITFMEVKGGGWVDNPFFFQTLCLAESIRWTPKPYYYYRKTNPNSSSNNIPDLSLPVRRMMDNLNVLEKVAPSDIAVHQAACARALQYMNGSTFDKHYTKQSDFIRPLEQQLMNRLDQHVIDSQFSTDKQRIYYQHRSELDTLIPDKKKVLLCSGESFDSFVESKSGAQVTYRQLITDLINERPDLQIYYLRNGCTRNNKKTDCHIAYLPTDFWRRLRSYEIVNFPLSVKEKKVTAESFNDTERASFCRMIEDFISEYGEFDIVQFIDTKNFPVEIENLKKKFPSTTFVISEDTYSLIESTIDIPRVEQITMNLSQYSHILQENAFLCHYYFNDTSNAKLVKNLKHAVRRTIAYRQENGFIQTVKKIFEKLF